MQDKLYDNADSFANSFDEKWKDIDCEDKRLKIDKVFELLSEHPFLVSNPVNARNLAEFRIFSLKKFH
jgi:arsenate reductase-like glutaredoxin family protein